MPNQARMQHRTVTPENTATSFASLQPESSKWWCRGAILKKRLPWVALK